MLPIDVWSNLSSTVWLSQAHLLVLRAGISIETIKQDQTGSNRIKQDNALTDKKTAATSEMAPDT
jgi:hypothetical protein